MVPLLPGHFCIQEFQPATFPDHLFGIEVGVCRVIA